MVDVTVRQPGYNGYIAKQSGANEPQNYVPSQGDYWLGTFYIVTVLYGICWSKHCKLFRLCVESQHFA